LEIDGIWHVPTCFVRRSTTHGSECNIQSRTMLRPDCGIRTAGTIPTHGRPAIRAAPTSVICLTSGKPAHRIAMARRGEAAKARRKTGDLSGLFGLLAGQK
jgi:hypothetical protein